MSARKTWALSVLAWGVMASVAQADPIPILWRWSAAWMGGTGVVEGTTGPGDTSAMSTPTPTPTSTPTPADPAPINPTPSYTPTPPPPPQPAPVMNAAPMMQASQVVSSSSGSVTASASGSPPDAYLNFGTSSYAEQSTLTTGTAQPWYDSPSVTKVFGGVPNAQQQQSFISAVTNDLSQTFQASGLTGSNAISLTTNPNAGAIHSMSIVSGLTYPGNPARSGSPTLAPTASA